MEYTILIVDDEATQRKVLSGFLKKQGYKIYEASSGNQAIEITSKNIIDLVITDFKMPDISGIEVLKLVRSINPEIAVIIMTAFGTIETAVEAMREGAYNYLTKPINLDHFMTKLAELLNGEEQQHTHAESSMSDIPQDSTSDLEDTSPIVSRLRLNNSKFSKVIARFASRLEEQLPAMDEAFLAKDFDALAQLGHWLKGAGGTVGFDVFYQPASELETAAKAMDIETVNRQLQHIHQLAGRIVVDDQPASAGHVPRSNP